MKYKVLIYIGILLFIGACSNDAVYYNVEQKRSVYFVWDRTSIAVARVDTAFFSFALYNEDEYEYKIPFKVIGMPIDRDQVCEVEVVADSSTAVENKHFKIERAVISKDKVEGNLSITLKRTEDIMENPVILYLKFKENDDFKPICNNWYRLSIVDGSLTPPAWWAPNYLGVYDQNNDRLYKKFLENFWQLEELKPIFYAEKVEEYGLYLENAPAGFFQVKGNIIWINYVFKPAYNFYSDPANIYEGFTMVNPDRFIR